MNQISTEKRARPTLGRARLEDVAAEAGVALATASRALRQPEMVAKDTRDRIERAVAKLGYIRDESAGNLASQQTRQVSVILPSFGTAAFNSTIQGVSDYLLPQYLLPQGFQLTISDMQFSGENETKLIASALGRRADAIILMDTMQPEEARDLLFAAKVPVVETWTLASEPIDMNVGFDNRAAAALATRLLDTGRRRLAMIVGPQTRNQRGRDRLADFLDTVRAAGLDDKLLVELPAPYHWKDAELALVKLMEMDPHIDGVFCSADSFAAGALFGAQRNGWLVPEQLALIGLGDANLTPSRAVSIDGRSPRLPHRADCWPHGQP